MVKVVFAGPSLYGCRLDHTDIEIRPPAAQGDLQAAVDAGANVIGLVDGVFETVAANWHKEILFALSQGVAVLGAASMGALRAAECRAFGMRPIGRIAEAYVSGDLDDDAAVAQLHGPADLGYIPVTDALVDCEAAIEALYAARTIGRGEAVRLLGAARAMFFKERTWRAVLAASGLGDARADEILHAVRAGRQSLKRDDALRLVEAVSRLPDRRLPPDPGWRLAETPAWARTRGRAPS